MVIPMIDKHTITWSWQQDHPRICTCSFLIWFCRMKCCQIWQPAVTLYKGWSACQILYKHFRRDCQFAKYFTNTLQILYKYFTNTLQGTVSVPNTLQILYKHFTRDGQCAKCANNQTPDRRQMPRCRERGLNRFEFLSKAWNQPAGRQRIKEDTERSGFWLQTFKSEQWGQFNGPALRMNACWDLRPSPPQ